MEVLAKGTSFFVDLTVTRREFDVCSLLLLRTGHICGGSLVSF